MRPFALYSTYCAITVVWVFVCYWIDDDRGAAGACVASLICFVPIAYETARQRVAADRSVTKLPIRRRWNDYQRGMMVRMGWVLIASVLVYMAAQDRVGQSFWLSVLVMYEFGLLVLAPWRPLHNS